MSGELLMILKKGKKNKQKSSNPTKCYAAAVCVAIAHICTSCSTSFLNFRFFYFSFRPFFSPSTDCVPRKKETISPSFKIGCDGTCKGGLLGFLFAANCWVARRRHRTFFRLGETWRGKQNPISIIIPPLNR